MGIDGGKKRRPNAVVRVLVIRDVSSRSWVAELFGETEVNDIDDIRGTVGAHDEISGFNIAVYEVVRMYEFNAGYLQMERCQWTFHTQQHEWCHKEADKYVQKTLIRCHLDEDTHERATCEPEAHGKVRAQLASVRLKQESFRNSSKV